VEDSLFNQNYLVVADIAAKERDSFIHLAISISIDQIKKHFSHFITTKESITYERQNRRFNIRESEKFLKLELSSKPTKASSKTNFKELLLELIKQEGLEIMTWSKKAINFKNRVNFVYTNGYKEFPDFSDKALLESLDIWLEPYLESITTLKALESLDIYSILLSQIDWQKQQLLDSLAPKTIKVPSGSNILVDYSDIKTPIMRVKIQEVFGLKSSPKILDNSMALQLHLLTPAMRPIQITYDLNSFWDSSYFEVRKELRGKYKKHYWPENPLEAIATNRTKKHM